MKSEIEKIMKFAKEMADFPGLDSEVLLKALQCDKLEFQEVEKEEFKPVYRKRHWKRAKGAVGIWKR